MVVATAGSASTGAIDDLDRVGGLLRATKACGSTSTARSARSCASGTGSVDLVAGIERADSIAFDLHKWLHVPYDAGAVLVRDGALHAATFADHAPYLLRTERGTAAGEPWFTDFGPELSRGFRALGVWFTMKTYGLDRFGELIARQCALARALGERIARTPPLELLAPVTLNIVCFRYRLAAESDADALNARIVVELQERGIAVPSTDAHRRQAGDSDERDESPHDASRPRRDGRRGARRRSELLASAYAAKRLERVRRLRRAAGVGTAQRETRSRRHSAGSDAPGRQASRRRGRRSRGR